MKIKLHTVGSILLWMVSIFFLLAALGGLLQADADYGLGFLLVSLGCMPICCRFKLSRPAIFSIHFLLVIGGIVITLLFIEVPAARPAARTPASAQPAFMQMATVVGIVDGDTIEVELEDGSTHQVYLLGIDSPNVNDCFAEQATEHMRTLVLNKEVRLEGTQQNAMGDFLRYVMLDTDDIGAEMIRHGYAKSYKEYAHPRASLYDLIQQAAFTTRRGLWGKVCATDEAGLPTLDDASDTETETAVRAQLTQ